MASLTTLPLSFRMPGLKPRIRAHGLFSGGGKGLSGRIMIGLGLGGLAAAFAAFTYYRNRTLIGAVSAIRNRRNTAATASDGPETVPVETASPIPAPAMQEASMDWILAGRGMDTLVPGAYSIPPIPTKAEPRDTPASATMEEAESLNLSSTDASTGPEASITPDRISPNALGYGAKAGASQSWVEALRKAMEHKPLKYGYDKSVWTAPLLGHYLQEVHGIAVTAPRLRSALKDLGYQWKHTHYAHQRPTTGRGH
jgi:hypothetical protein